MAGPYKTRCPHCGAQFKISDEHLNQARGAVRCGSCLQIFQATDHLIGDAAPRAGDGRWERALDEDAPRLAADGDGHGGLELSDAFLDMDGDQRGDRFADLDDALGGAPSVAGPDHSQAGDDHDRADESWAEALLRDLEDEDEDDHARPAAPAGRERGAPASSVPPASALLTRNTADPAPDRPEEDDSDPFDFLNRNAARHRAANERLDYVAPPPAGLLKWGLLSLLALLVLVGQYAVFHFQELARQPQWRPYYAQACQVLGCALPLHSDPSRLRGANLVVRSHPRFRDALMVDALLFNEADWPQPFPVLELTFTDLQGQVVASRRFAPAEYLRGDFSGATAMPSGTPVHIGLEIVDPGPRAVNYDLRLLPAEAAPARVSRAP
ncbi:zinc-ribbon and DUF3426 domain-containing protein [Alcanivorax marinus]|uniref:Zinc-ribbon and DUF3426 domain-containing protein n=1 Tax=Alloalcanivorax marinus TaxID=1177169 RepID=A0A9Q3YMT0_9GAMM|nr:zinc-ribbon and DUF3426 domain-containing protein [Alloalcanivorax marinus]MCC4307170.1 zinc-ribbon and DUF3426 domain-containing protein [Alloalcanivorax marinus]MCU5786213.1 hypothetical protein [Alloalcanivorax marinus]